MSRWIVPVVTLPGTVLLFVPLVILWLTRNGNITAAIAAPPSAPFLLAAILAIPGFIFALWSTTSFFRFGEGTAAPWDPPKKLVIRGPYRHVRNPMLTGVILLLFAEALLFQSWPLALWAAIFFLGNAVYFPKVEEPGLRKRFSEDYARYCENVGRWIPRMTAWKP